MDSTLAKIQLPSRSQAQPRLEPPEFLRLPDGREFCTRDLLKQTTKSVNYNLRSRHPHKPINRQSTKKYHWADYEFMATANIEQIQQRYLVNENYARILKTKSRNVIRSGRNPD